MLAIFQAGGEGGGSAPPPRESLSGQRLLHSALGNLPVSSLDLHQEKQAQNTNRYRGSHINPRALQPLFLFTGRKIKKNKQLRINGLWGLACRHKESNPDVPTVPSGSKAI